MSGPGPLARREWRAIAREDHRHEPRHRPDPAAARRRGRLRSITFGAVVVAVLGIGGYLAFGDFLGQRGAVSGDRIAVQASMAGFTPKEIRVPAGQTVTLDFWTQDSSGHLKGGVHTMIGQELGIQAELPGADGVSESRMAVAFTAPMTPGEYDIYCDTCCGGRESPSMHGRIVVEAG